MNIDENANGSVAAFAAALDRRGYPLWIGGREAGAAELAKAGEALTFCPLHESEGAHDPSLTITVARDGGRVLTYCHACGESPFTAIMRGQVPECQAEYRPKPHGGGAGDGGGWSDPNEKPRKQDRQGSRIASLGIRTEEDYQRWSRQESEGFIHETGVHYYGPTPRGAQFAKVRFSDKLFLWFRRNGGGYWCAGLRDQTPPLYGSWSLAERGGAVWAVEGEKDAGLLLSWGLAAVSTAQHPVGDDGGSWPEREAARERNSAAIFSVLAGRNVVIIPDADDAGALLAERFAIAAERAGAASVTVAEPLGNSIGYDVSDWAADGGNREALEALARDGRPPRKAQPETSFPSSEADCPVGGKADTGSRFSNAGNRHLSREKAERKGRLETEHPHRLSNAEWQGSPEGARHAYRELCRRFAAGGDLFTAAKWLKMADRDGTRLRWMITEKLLSIAPDGAITLYADPVPPKGEKDPGWAGVMKARTEAGGEWRAAKIDGGSWPAEEADAEVSRLLSLAATLPGVEPGRITRATIARGMQPAALRRGRNAASVDLVKRALGRVLDRGDWHEAQPGEAYRRGHGWAWLPPTYAPGAETDKERLELMETYGTASLSMALRRHRAWLLAVGENLKRAEAA